MDNRLYSYCLRVDDGAAPNPFWGTCTLAICKPAIRRTADRGDWIAGLGSSKDKKLGDISRHLVYAMEVEGAMTLEEYDAHCKKHIPHKIPDWTNTDLRMRVGDCIYDFSKGGRPTIRQGVHDERNRKVDLGGKNVLLSEQFFYFGDNPIALPDELTGISHAAQGHKSTSNNPYREIFAEWIESLGLRPGSILGEPLHKDVLSDPDACALCAAKDYEEDKKDVECL